MNHLISLHQITKFTGRLKRLATALIMIGLLFAIAGPAAPPVRAQTQVDCINDVGDVAGLIDAINAANTDPAQDIIELAANCVYTISNPADKINLIGLPQITANLTIRGNGAVIERASNAAQAFRVMQIGNAAQVTLQDLTIQNGQAVAGLGGGLQTTPITFVRLENVTFRNNTAENGGGGLAAFGNLTITDGDFIGNKTSNGSGGGLLAFSPATVNDTRFVANQAQSGGGIYAVKTLSLDSSTFDDNKAVNAGGGVFAEGGVTATGSFFDQNQAGSGGGLHSHRTAQLAHNVFSLNGSSNKSHALFLAQTDGGSSDLVNNVWVDGGDSPNPIEVICLLCDTGSTGSVTVRHNTIAKISFFDQAPAGSDIAITVKTGSVRVVNTIITGYRTGLNNQGGSVTTAKNLYFDNDQDEVGDVLVSAPPVTSQNPRFVALDAINFQLQPGSPAIDRALPADSPALDRVGVHRPQGNGPDIGAHEFDLGQVPPDHLVTIGCEAGPGDEADLIAAVRQANDQPGANRIELAANCVYTLTEAIPFETEATGLPVITDYLVIGGNGATLERDGNAAAEFRILTVVDASLLVQDLTIARGKTGADGGGIGATGLTSFDGTLALTNVTLRDNASANNGGAVAINHMQLIAHQSQFEDNRALKDGGAIAAHDSLIKISGSLFESNQGTERGGGIFANESLLTLSNSRLAENVANQGGAVHASAQANITGNRFVGNEARTEAGLLLRAFDENEINNNLWVNNRNGDSGPQAQSGVIDLSNGNSSATINLAHNTIANTTLVDGIAVGIIETSSNLRNNIVSHFTRAVDTLKERKPERVSISLISEHNLFFGSEPSPFTTGNGNLTGDPLFVDPVNGDFHLQPDSPARDNGLDAGVTVDLDGAARPFDEGFDIGAFEFGSLAPNPEAGSRVYLPVVTQ